MGAIPSFMSVMSVRRAAAACASLAVLAALAPPVAGSASADEETPRRVEAAPAAEAVPAAGAATVSGCAPVETRVTTASDSWWGYSMETGLGYAELAALNGRSLASVEAGVLGAGEEVLLPDMGGGLFPPSCVEAFLSSPE